MFLQKQELKTVMSLDLLSKITNNDEVVENIVAECIDVFKSYLHQYYDVEAIFAATGNDRNKTVLKHLKAVVANELYALRSSAQNETNELRVTEALRWLERVADGKIKPPLPLKQVDNNGDGTLDGNEKFLKLGSRKNYTNHF